jgi:hypothetical protein|tara:strand:+ start:215 stop:610 length:396 start_codon:yes stop_codon:yes gene_type:complete
MAKRSRRRSNTRRKVKKKSQFDKKIMTKISNLKNISGKGGLQISSSELESRYESLSINCKYSDAKMAEEVAQISGIETVSKECRESLMVIWDYFHNKQELNDEIDYLETYLADGIDKELSVRECEFRKLKV